MKQEYGGAGGKAPARVLMAVKNLKRNIVVHIVEGGATAFFGCGLGTATVAAAITTARFARFTRHGFTTTRATATTQQLNAISDDFG